MNGKLVGGFIVGSAFLAGAAVWYLQTYYFYVRPDPAGVEVKLTSMAGGVPEAIPVDGLQVIDATSSPIRFRACFETPLSLATLTETYRIYDQPVPLTAPGWFDWCRRRSDRGSAGLGCGTRVPGQIRGCAGGRQGCGRIRERGSIRLAAVAPERGEMTAVTPEPIVARNFLTSLSACWSFWWAT